MRPTLIIQIIAVVAVLAALAAPGHAQVTAPAEDAATTSATTTTPANPAPAGATTAVAAAKTTTATKAAPAPGASGPESQPIPEGSSGPVSVDAGLGGTAFRLLLGLVIVVGLIMGVWYVMKRIQRSRYPALDETRPQLIGVLATTPLGPNRALHIVRVGDEVVLVGATDHAVQTVAHLDADTAAAVVRSLPPTDGGPGAAARTRAVETASGSESWVDRLRAMTTRQ